ncbi:hypothetical protein BGX34_001981, partial [Mortierella sp. NVP85]
MSSLKDAVTSAPQDKISKRSANHSVRLDPKHHVKKDNDLQAPPHSDSSRDSATLPASSNHSRQTWTHMAFTKYIPGSDIADKGHHQPQYMPAQAHSHTSTASGLDLAGVCTVLIEPHTFVDTKFFTVLRSSLEKSEAGVKSEPGASDQTNRPKHQVVMEFKENPGTLWLFPEEASLEFTPANECKKTQISASFRLSMSASTGVMDRSGSGDQHTQPVLHTITLVIQQATTALREGLELAVKGTKTTVHPSSHKPVDPPSRPHTPSTYSEDPSEILGSGKPSNNNSNHHHNHSNSTSSSSPAKRKQDTMNENQKSLKTKRPKDNHDEKSTGSSKKKALAGAGPKKNGLSAPPSNGAQQKRCGYCNCTITPMWRRGPSGPSTLCNACGVKWKHGKILQDVQDTQQQQTTQRAGGGGGHASNSNSATHTRATSSSSSSNNNSKHSNHASQNGSGRHGDDTKVESNTAKKRSSSSSHTASSRRALETKTGDNAGSKENSKRSRAVEADKIVPVKKRHSSKASVSPPGPRMVSVHELGDPARTPFEGSSSTKKHVYDDEIDEDLQLPSGHFERSRNGHGHSDHMAAGTASSSASTISTRSDVAAPGIDNDMEADESMPANDTGADEEEFSESALQSFDAFPLQLPTISIAFGPSNASYTFPNCGVILHESHFQIKLAQADERTEIDVWKEGIEATESEAVNVGDGERMIIMKILLRQYLTRFDKELLNPDRNECLIVFQFRERLD